MSTRRRDHLIDAAIALAGVGVHVVAVILLDRFPPSSTLEYLFVGLPIALGLVGAVALAVRGERRPQIAACGWTWTMALFTLPAFGLGLALMPGAALMTLPVLRPTGVPRQGD